MAQQGLENGHYDGLINALALKEEENYLGKLNLLYELDSTLQNDALTQLRSKIFMTLSAQLSAHEALDGTLPIYQVSRQMKTLKHRQDSLDQQNKIERNKPINLLNGKKDSTKYGSALRKQE